MKYIDEFRDPALARQLIAQIRATATRRSDTRPIRLMEFCGGHTHAISRFGLRELLAPDIELRSGPGCPVCVTSAADLDLAIALADVPGVILATFGDMVRVPGSRGKRCRLPPHAVRTSASSIRRWMRWTSRASIHSRQVVFLGVGFETTAPGIAAALVQAEADGVPNFSVLSLHKLTPPAMRAILDAGEVALDGIIGPGHVSAIIGSDAWAFLPRDYHIPCAISGFEPLDILSAIGALVQAVVTNEPAVINTYARGVRPEGNPIAQRLLDAGFRGGSGELARLRRDSRQRPGAAGDLRPPGCCAADRVTFFHRRDTCDKNRPAVAAGTCCAASSRRPSARCSGASAHRAIPSARAWSAPRARARRISSMRRDA